MLLQAGSECQRMLSWVQIPPMVALSEENRVSRNRVNHSTVLRLLPPLRHATRRIEVDGLPDHVHVGFRHRGHLRMAIFAHALPKSLRSTMAVV